MSTDTGRRPYAKVYPYTWMAGDQPTAGIVFRHGPKPFLHVTADEARQLADRLHDMADTLDTEPVKSAKAATAAVNPTEPEKAPQEPQPCYVSRSDTLTNAAGTPEPPLPTTSPE